MLIFSKKFKALFIDKNMYFIDTCMEFVIN